MQKHFFHRGMDLFAFSPFLFPAFGSLEKNFHDFGEPGDWQNSLYFHGSSVNPRSFQILRSSWLVLNGMLP